MNTEIVKIFSYKGNEVTFIKNHENIMINATEMMRPFLERNSNLRITDFLLDQSRAQLVLLLCKRNSLIEFDKNVDNSVSLRISDLANLFPESIKVVKGGLQKQGTWFHVDIAIEFARWLSPHFSLWCNDRIKELLTTGSTSLFNIPKTLSEALRLAADQAEKIELQQKQINQLEPKAEYHDKVLQGTNLITTTIIAKDLGMSAVSLNNLLNKHRIQYKVQGVWVLYDKYQNEGYTHTKTHSYLNTAGEERNSIMTYWTEKGRKFVTNFILSLNTEIN